MNRSPRPITRSQSTTRAMARVIRPPRNFPNKQRIAVDRLRQNARKRVSVVLAVDGIEAQPIAMSGTSKVSQVINENSCCWPDPVKNLRKRNGSSATFCLISWLASTHGAERDHDHDELKHDEANAGEVIRQLLERDHAEALKGRAFTPHGGLLPSASPRLASK